MEMYDAMRAAFGHRQWWPGDGALEICVGAILTQNTNWSNVEKAIANLKAADAMSVTHLHKLPHESLAELIRPAGYYNIKAKRLKNFIAKVYAEYGDDIEAFLDRSVETLRVELLGVNGIGPETADSIILYAAGKPTFVVDAYTGRILLRHGLISPEDTYESIKELCESSLPTDVELWNDFHAQFVAVGARHCKPRPRCDGCPLERFDHDISAALDG
ncbi:MAG: endonuclease III domain-containing protein [Phycisphaerae bacterium]|nr:endonuclease III domain-containing protein [Phycisphaerae bacterium]